MTVFGTGVQDALGFAGLLRAGDWAQFDVIRPIFVTPVLFEEFAQIYGW